MRDGGKVKKLIQSDSMTDTDDMTSGSSKSTDLKGRLGRMFVHEFYKCKIIFKIDMCQ